MKVYEHAVDRSLKERVRRLVEAGDLSGLLKEATLVIGRIKGLLNEVKFSDLRYRVIERTRSVTIVAFDYSTEAVALFENLSVILSYSGEESDEVTRFVFGDGPREYFLEVEVHGENMNKIDVLNGLPLFMRGLGLGKKVYKRLIVDFGYLSSFEGYGPSKESSMVWNSLADDHELYTFTNDGNIICFHQGVPLEGILEVLGRFYRIPGEVVVLDSDFLRRYDVSGTFLEPYATVQLSTDGEGSSGN